MSDELRKAAQAALEALESLQGGCTDSNDGTVEAITVWCPEIIDALRAALAAAQPPAAMPAPLSRQQIDNIMTQHYPLDSLLRENVDAFEACVRDIEAAISAQPVQPSMLGALNAVTAQCNRLKAALELACSHLTDEQAAEVAAAIPPKDGSAQPVPATGAQPWQPIETMPSDGGSYLVADAVRGMVAPLTRGVIHNNPGTAHDWQYGEAITHWMPLPAPPLAAAHTEAKD